MMGGFMGALKRRIRGKDEPYFQFIPKVQLKTESDIRLAFSLISPQNCIWGKRELFDFILSDLLYDLLKDRPVLFVSDFDQETYDDTLIEEFRLYAGHHVTIKQGTKGELYAAFQSIPKNLAVMFVKDLGPSSIYGDFCFYVLVIPYNELTTATVDQWESIRNQYRFYTDICDYKTKVWFTVNPNLMGIEELISKICCSLENYELELEVIK